MAVRILVLFAVAICFPLQAAYPPRFDENEFREEVYVERDDEKMRLWVLEPKESDGSISKAKNRPAVVLFFGGSWKFGSPDSLRKHARHLASRGLVALLVDYRVANRHGVRIADCVADAKAALKWTRENAERLGVDAKRIAAGGASAGGHLAAMVGLDKDVDEISRANALLLFNPPLVLAPFEGKTFGFTHFFRKDLVGGVVQQFSPIHLINESSPPTWITHGTQDYIVPFETSQTFQKEMTTRGVKCELFEATRMPHAFHYNEPWFSHAMVSMETFLTELGWLEKEGAPK